ncbi:hypothetical protein [Mesorhizobium sp. CA7]|uniref:hypothetical protein n=1 Tax=Mesorhizobium sp. CA7 TaxID=588501 RepID=UPI001CD0188E|nr:hypothetical protein [Mesorhizobium sp. CA7]MBZ9815991.1 hypothetical protein [Mesorhizobium sp. CA7]
MAAIFTDRREAGRRLAGELVRFAGRDDVIVLALPPGALDEVADLAAQWFLRHLISDRSASRF